MNAAKKSIATTDMSMSGLRVAVVGGGIGGLTAALAFAKSGAQITVYEQASALTEVGAGLQVTPNGMSALRALGLGDAISKSGVAAQAVVPMDGLMGQPVTRFSLMGRDYHFLHRADLIDILAQSVDAAGAKVILGQRVMDTATLPDDHDLIVGADGVHSVTREVLNGATRPFFTGQVAWRAVVKSAHPPEARIWMLPGRHVVTYPLAGGRLNIVAVEERAEFAEDGWHQADDPANLRLAFADTALELQSILSRVKEVHLWGLLRNPVADRMTSDGLALIGDAAHPTLPFLAQGANLAIEDAFVLARCVAEDGVGAGLQRYETLRKPRVTRAIAAANANARNYHLSGVRRRLAHMGLKGLGALAPNAFLGRLSWLYDHDVTA